MMGIAHQFSTTYFDVVNRLGLTLCLSGVCEKRRDELAPKKVNLPDEPLIEVALGACPTLPFPSKQI